MDRRALRAVPVRPRARRIRAQPPVPPGVYTGPASALGKRIRSVPARARSSQTNQPDLLVRRFGKRLGQFTYLAARLRLGRVELGSFGAADGPEGRPTRAAGGGASGGPCETRWVPDLELFLASGSPRRRELLSRIGIFPTVEPTAIDETPAEGEAASAYVERMARGKAIAAARPGRVVIAATPSSTGPSSASPMIEMTPQRCCER